MKDLWKSLVIVSVLASSGCTIVGGFADSVIAADNDEHDSQRQSDRSKSKEEGPFQFLGSEIDKAIFKEFQLAMDNAKKDKSNNHSQEDEEQKAQSTFIGVCKAKVQSDDKCYSSDYYEKFRQQIYVDAKEGGE